MAAPSYTEDLVDISLAESTTDGGTWAQIGGGGNIAMSAGPDYAMQGTNCVDAKVSNLDRGMAVPFAAFTPGANEHLFIWMFTSTPGLAAPLANGGVCAVVGTSTTAYVRFHVDGGDTFGAQGRVGRCYPIRYRTDATAAAPYRTVTGAPGASPALAGGQWNIVGTVRGSNVAVDAIRRGTGAYLTAGELISAGDASDNPCTFTGFSTLDQTTANRWGILLNLGGGSFEQQGRFVIGQNNAGVATAARFRDSNKTIFFVDTPHALADFSQVVLDHASTRVEWTSISLVGLGTTNPGRLVVNIANPTFVWNGGNNANIATTVLRSNSSLNGVSWRACGQVTPNGATLTDCSLINSTATSALLWNDSVDTNGRLDGTSFSSAGTGHAIELGSSTPANIGLFNNTFTGYGSDGTTDAAIYNNSGKQITISILGGGDVPTVRNGAGASTTIVTGQRNFSFSVTDIAGNPLTGYEWRIYEASVTPGVLGTVALAGEESAVASSQNYSYSYSNDTDVVLQVLHPSYVEAIIRTSLVDADRDIAVQLIPEENI